MKPGIKTTEFWVALLIPLLGGITKGLFDWAGIPFPEEMIYGGIGTAITYIITRGWTKSAEAKSAGAPIVSTTTGS